MKRRILHIIDTTGPGGAETVFVQLAAARRQSDHTSLALIRGPGWVMDALASEGVETEVLECKGSFNLRFLFSVIRLIRKRNITVIQTHLLGSNVYAAIAGLITQTPVICTFHGSVDISPNERFRFLKFLFIRLGASKVVAVTQKLKELLESTTVLKNGSVQVISNGVDLSVYSQEKSLYLREKYSLPEGTLIIGSLGNVRPAKNYFLALEVAAELARREIDFHYFIAGDDKNVLGGELRKRAAELGLAERISWLGFIDKPEEYLASLDVFLLSSSSEGHPLAVTQALASGTPVVTTTCGVEEILSDEQNAYVSATNDPSDLADKLVSIKTQPEKAAEIGASGRALVESLYSSDRMTDSYFKLYQLLQGTN